MVLLTPSSNPTLSKSNLRVSKIKSDKFSAISVISFLNLSADKFKNEITDIAENLSDLILETRRLLLDSVGLDEGVRRTKGLDSHPNVAVSEISGKNIKLPKEYSNLNKVPVTTAADMRTGVYYTTHANKRAFPFFALDHNPVKNEKFNPEEYVSIPFEIGAWNILCYIHKTRGYIEIEPRLYFYITTSFMNVT